MQLVLKNFICLLLGLVGLGGWTSVSSVAAEVGVTDDEIVLGSVLALRGRAEGLGKGMQTGIQAALENQKVQGRSIKVLFENDNYEPELTIKATNQLVETGIFLMIGNVGTPTAKVSLPILAKNKVPAVGFFTGSGILRQGQSQGPILNFRASYRQEIKATIDAAIANGLDYRQVCAYVQNDAYGMSGLEGIHLALQNTDASEKLINLYEKIIATEGDVPQRNNLGPVGVYQRNSVNIKTGYQSLKIWERQSRHRCKLVVTVGAYANIAHFARYARENGENWIISAVSFTGAENYRNDLKRYQVNDGILMTQVVPLPQSNLEIVEEAREHLKDKMGLVSLEGYIAGKMTLHILNSISGELTRERFMKQSRKTKFQMGGLTIDLTKNGFQASDLVVLTQLTAHGFLPMTDRTLKRWFSSP